MRKIILILFALSLVSNLASCYIEGPDRSKYSSKSDNDSSETVEDQFISSALSDGEESGNAQESEISELPLDPRLYAKAIYTDYLKSGGYSSLIVLGDGYDQSKLSVSTCLVDLNQDGVSELLIHLAKHDSPAAVTSALLGIKANRVVVLAKAEQSGGTMGGDGLYLKNDTESGETVVALVGNYSVGYAQQDSCFSVISNSDLYNNSVGKNTFSFDAQSLYLNSKYMPSEVSAIKSETKIYVHDGDDFYAYSINGRYLTRNAYKDALGRFEDATGNAKLQKTSYAEPII